MTNLLNEVNSAVKKGTVKDQNESKGDFEIELVPPGTYPARFVGWIEVGDRDGGEWKGKKKPNVRKAYAEFELVSKKLAQEIEVDGVKKTIYPTVRQLVDVKTGEKANLTKLFKQMANGRDLMHIAQMLEEPFLVTVEHWTKGEGDNARTYETLRNKEKGWLIKPPLVEVPDEEGEIQVKKVNVIPQTVPTKLLLWDDPSIGQWDSIAGREFSYKDKAGNEQTFPGGYLQYVCVHQALDFSGSALEAMLGGEALGDLTDDEIPQEDEPSLEEQLDDEIPDHGADEVPDDLPEDDGLDLDDLPD